MNIGFVYENGFSSKNGSNHLLNSIIVKMIESGNEVFLIESVYAVNRSNDFVDTYRLDGFHHIPIKMKEAKKNYFIRRYINGLIFTFKFSKKIRKTNIDLFFIQSSPTVSFTIGKAKKTKKHVIYNIHDIFPGSAIKLGIIKSKLLNTIFKKIQRFGYKKADSIIVVSNDMKEKLLLEKVSESKIEIVNTWFDSKNIKLVKNIENSFVKENEIDLDKLIIQYAGNIGQVFGLDEFSKLVNLLKENNQVEFHIIGSGVKLQKLKELTKNCNIRFFDWQDNSRMSEVFSYPDIEIIPLHEGVIGNNVPSKMALAMACGKPILNIVEKSHYFDLFETNQIGFSFQQNEVEDAAKFISKIIENKSLDHFDKNRIMNFNSKMYSMETNTEKVIKIIEKIYKRGL
jgi:glycosyltransferase involved in cell wall biosynthesis